MVSRPKTYDDQPAISVSQPVISTLTLNPNLSHFNLDLIHPSLSRPTSPSPTTTTTTTSHQPHPHLMSLSLLASRSISTTDRRHIDPNPDRLPITNKTTSSSLPASSLLLLSTSAEAAVLESRKFEKGSRLQSNQIIKLSTSLNNHYQNHQRKNHSQHQERVHHRLIEAVNINQHQLKQKDIKNGLIFKCEKCPKVYRHPQCLVKHRWEHTSYWADASKLMLSKHQQVQMLEAAAILATPSGSLPESRSLWPAAVSPSEAGLLGSDQVNIDVIQSQARAHRSSSSPCSSAPTNPTPTALNQMQVSEEEEEGEDVEMDEEEETGDEEEDEEEEEIMFEMSINGDETHPVVNNSIGKHNSNDEPITFSISAPPPMGYFQPRATSVTTTLESKPEPFIAYGTNRRTSSICSSTIGRSYYNPDNVFHHPPPYADSSLRFQAVSRLDEKAGAQEVVDDDEEDEDEDEGFGIRDVSMNGSGDEVVGMEL